MLVEFRVKNFRSLRDEQVLSMVATKDKVLLDTNTLPTNIKIKAAPNLLRSIAIYGGNASGKSNVIKAMQYMRGVVVESATIMQPGRSFSNFQPFMLDNKFVNEPTKFEITFLIGGIRYEYGFTFTTQRIISEQLLVYVKSRPQCWFQRSIDTNTGKDLYTFSSGLKGAKNIWESVTRPNSLFLSMAALLNSEQLLPVFDWFNKYLVIFNEANKLDPTFSLQMLHQPDGHKEICDFLKAADISITDIKVITSKIPVHGMRIDHVTGKAEVTTNEIETSQPVFHHVTEHGKAEFDFKEESSGTINLLVLAGPVLDILKKGLVLVVDELEASLHPLLVQKLVQLFHRPETNTGGAQLIFTTHNTSLLNACGLFRRDQIWFLEKDTAQASNLYSLSDFSPRKNEALERGYLQGRYGAIPFLGDLMGRKR